VNGIVCERTEHSPPLRIESIPSWTPNVSQRYFLSNDLHATRTTIPTNSLEQVGTPSLSINQNVSFSLNIVDEVEGPVTSRPITMLW
jgi:hypothetical protein